MGGECSPSWGGESGGGILGDGGGIARERFATQTYIDTYIIHKSREHQSLKLESLLTLSLPKMDISVLICLWKTCHWWTHLYKTMTPTKNVFLFWITRRGGRWQPRECSWHLNDDSCLGFELSLSKISFTKTWLRMIFRAFLCYIHSWPVKVNRWKIKGLKGFIWKNILKLNTKFNIF